MLPGLGHPELRNSEQHSSEREGALTTVLDSVVMTTDSSTVDRFFWLAAFSRAPDHKISE